MFRGACSSCQGTLMNATCHRLAFRHVRQFVSEGASIRGNLGYKGKAGFPRISQPNDAVLPFSTEARNRNASWAKGWHHLRKKSDKLLEEIKSNKKAPGHVALRVQNVLLEMVGQRSHAGMGPLASRLLDAAEQDLSRSKMSNRQELNAKLYQLVRRIFFCW